MKAKQKQKNAVITECQRKIKAIQKATGWSIRQIERQAGIGQGGINRILQGGREPNRSTEFAINLIYTTMVKGG